MLASIKMNNVLYIYTIVLGTDPTALPKVVNIYKEILVDKAKEHNRRVGEVEKGGMAFPYDIKINVPTTPEVPVSNQGGWRIK